MKQHCLSDLRCGQHAQVRHLTQQGDIRRRLQDLGLTPGVNVTCLLEGPGGGIAAYRIRGAVVALRREDSAGVVLAQETP